MYLCDVYSRIRFACLLLSCLFPKISTSININILLRALISCRPFCAACRARARTTAANRSRSRIDSLYLLMMTVDCVCVCECAFSYATIDETSLPVNLKCSQYLNLEFIKSWVLCINSWCVLLLACLLFRAQLNRIIELAINFAAKFSCCLSSSPLHCAARLEQVACVRNGRRLIKRYLD